MPDEKEFEELLEAKTTLIKAEKEYQAAEQAKREAEGKPAVLSPAQLTSTLTQAQSDLNTLKSEAKTAADELSKREKAVKEKEQELKAAQEERDKADASVKAAADLIEAKIKYIGEAQQWQDSPNLDERSDAEITLAKAKVEYDKASSARDKAQETLEELEKKYQWSFDNVAQKKSAKKSKTTSAPASQQSP